MTCSVAPKVCKFGLILFVALTPLGVSAFVVGQDAVPPKAAPPKGEAQTAVAPKTEAPKAQAKGIRLPAWAAKADWKTLASPFEEAAAKGGAIVLQLPKAFERQLALANNKARAINGAVQGKDGRYPHYFERRKNGRPAQAGCPNRSAGRGN